MKRILTALAILFSVAALAEDWAGSGGEFKVSGDMISIRSGESNPVFYQKKASRQDCRISFELVRRGNATFQIYVGWRYPEFIRLDFAPDGTLRFNPAGGESSPVRRYRQSELLRVELSIAGEQISCQVNGEEAGNFTHKQPVRGAVAFGGSWNSDFEIRKLTIEPVKAPKPPVADRFTRPEIRNGTFYVDGKPAFMLGVNDTFNFWEFGPFNALPPFAPNDVFTDLMSRETARKMGFNSLHVPVSARQAAEGYLEEIGLTPEQADQLFGLGYPQHWSERARHRERIAGIPLIVDFSALHLFTMANQRERIQKAGAPADLYHDGGFMPYNPELELGRKIYETYFKGGAEYWLNDGNSNPWVYELFNELQWYHSKHSLNKRLFGGWLKKKYGTLDRLRQVWGEEAPDSFESVAALSPWTGKAMKADWMMFLGDRFVEIFDAGKAAIQSVDPRRKNVYFDIEIAVSSVWYEQNGIDYHKLMKSADIFGTEGGMPFGIFAEKEVGYLDDVMNNSKVKVMFVNDLARSFAGEKPVLNQESYVRRTHGRHGIVPVKRADFPTLFWFEVFHGFSGSQVYCWWQGYKNNNWKDLKEARETTKTVPPALLNPYAYPFESLSGFRDFEAEIGRMAEIALPSPRVANDIAILYSLPSVWRQPHAVSGNQKFPYQQNCFNWYDAFLRRQLPVAVITEQELIERGPGSYRVIAVPYPSHGFPETVAKLREFAAGGGVVIAGEGSLAFDPYGHPRKGAELAGKNIYRIPAGIPVPEQRAALLKALERSGYRAPFQVSAEETALLAELEARVIRRDGIDLYFFCNWDGRTAGLAKLHPAGLPGSGFHVTDMVTMRPLLSPSGKSVWSAEELAAGVPVAIPSQERVLVSVSTVAQTDGVPESLAAVAERAKRLQRERQMEIARLDGEFAAEEKQAREAHLAARKPFPADPARCFPLDLAAVVNMDFRDEKAGDRKGGWTDQGAMDFREFPVGSLTCSGVPFSVIDPAKNGGKACLVLAGTVKYFPAESADIPVGSKVKNLYFLHTAAWGGGEGRFLDYRIDYEDGTHAVFPVDGRKECADWVGNQPIANGSIAWETVKESGIPIGAYAVRWRNPFPEKTVRSLRAVSACGEAVPIVIAITAEH